VSDDLSRKIAAARVRDLRAAENAVKRLAAKMHQEWGMKEGDLIKLVSESVYDYFDSYWDLREMIGDTGGSDRGDGPH
jgi:hypothetical protein